MARAHLRTKLFRGKLESGDNLLGQVSGICETEGEKRDLGDQGVVWDHHGHGSEQSLPKAEYF